MSHEGITQILVCAVLLGGVAATALAVKEIVWATLQLRDFLKRRTYAAPDPSTRIIA